MDLSAFESLKPTKFVGYEKYECNAKVLYVEKHGDQVLFALDQTPFYAESGGQVAVIGKLGNVQVLDVQKFNNGVYLHTGKGKIKKGDKVQATVDVLRREQIRRHHSLAHLLQLALRTVLGDHVEQQGSLVTEDRTLFDFSHPRSVKPEKLREIERHVMEYVTAASDVEVVEMPLTEAKKKGAIALFSEKYGDKVRTIRMGESFELCGGTHVGNTAKI